MVERNTDATLSEVERPQTKSFWILIDVRFWKKKKIDNIQCHSNTVTNKWCFDRAVANVVHVNEGRDFDQN